jgi:hypothetical protein
MSLDAPCFCNPRPLVSPRFRGTTSVKSITFLCPIAAYQTQFAFVKTAQFCFFLIRVYFGLRFEPITVWICGLVLLILSLFLLIIGVQVLFFLIFDVQIFAFLDF